MSSHLPGTGTNAGPVRGRRVDSKDLKTTSVAADEEGSSDQSDLRSEVLAIVRRPLPRQRLREMAMLVVRHDEIAEIADGRRSAPKQGKVLRDALYAAEKRLKAAQKSVRQGLEAYYSADSLEWIERTYTTHDGKKRTRADYVAAIPQPRMPSKEEAARRMMESLEREHRDHPDRFLDDAQFAELEERLRPRSSVDQALPRRAELAAIISEVKYKLRGQEFDSINAARKTAKVRKQTAQRVRKHRAKKADT